MYIWYHSKMTLAALKFWMYNNAYVFRSSFKFISSSCNLWWIVISFWLNCSCLQHTWQKWFHEVYLHSANKREKRKTNPPSIIRIMLINIRGHKNVGRSCLNKLQLRCYVWTISTIKPWKSIPNLRVGRGAPKCRGAFKMVQFTCLPSHKESTAYHWFHF